MGTRGMQQSITSSRFAIKISVNGSINLFDDGQIQKGDLSIHTMNRSSMYLYQRRI